MARLFGKTIDVMGHHSRAVIDLEEPAQGSVLRVRGVAQTSEFPFPPDAPLDLPGAPLRASIAFELELNCETGDILFQVGDREIRRNVGQMLAGRAAEEVIEEVMDLFGSSLTETVGNLIPLGDPFLGCLLKSVATALVGQTVKCYDRTRDIAGGFNRCRAVAACLRQNIGWMVGKAAIRFGKCLVFA